MNEDAWIVVSAVIVRTRALLMGKGEESGALGVLFMTARRSSNR